MSFEQAQNTEVAGQSADAERLIELVPCGLQKCDPSGLITFSNPAYSKMCGYPPEEVIGQYLWDLSGTDDERQKLKNHLSHVVEARPSPASCTTITRRADGSLFDARIDWAYIPGKDGALAALILVITDVSERKVAERNLRRSEKKYRDLFEKSRDAILIIENNQFVECNRATLEMLGYTDKQAFLQQHPSKLSPPTQPDGRNSEEKADEMMRIALEQGSNRFEWDHVRANGEVFPVEVLLTPLVTESGTRVIHTVWRDITLQKQQRDEILFQAHYDSLTRLPNRFLSLDRLDQLIKEATRDHTKVAVLFLDLDNFKTVNDTLGHEWGDKILVEAAQRLQQSIRNADTVGRLGGDEFIVILGNLSEISDSSLIATELLECFRKPFLIQDREIMLTASIGIACYPDDAENAGDLLRLADTAMYHSKDQGRNIYHYFTKKMDRDVARRLQLEQQLHGALERREFSLRYHPLVCLRTNKIIGAEALLRWNNPSLGWVSPTEFIGISEQTGHIVEIGEFVLREATQQAALWNRAFDGDFKIALNISPRQLRDVTLVDRIAAALNETGMSSHLLELEITEGVLMSGHSLVDETLKKIHAMNLRLAMDDFGTGYSSLSYLRQYPFDTLKIDRSFVQDITTNMNDRTVVKGTIQLAQGLGLKVVAEGVETEDQKEILENLGCNYAQGFLFCQPLKPDDFVEFYGQWR